MSRGEVFGILGASAVAIGIGVIGYRLVFGQRERRAAEAKIAPATTKATPGVEREFGRDEPIATGSSAKPASSLNRDELVEIALGVIDEMARPNITGEDVQKVVTKITPRVKGECWEPALDARESGEPASARVSFELTINSAGEVERIQGRQVGPGYPKLVGCIENILRQTKFPLASNSTTVSIPFVFAAE